MLDVRIVAYYTSQSDTWESIISNSGISAEEFSELNPHISDLPDIEPGIPLNIPASAKYSRFSNLFPSIFVAGKSAYEYAKDELLNHVSEVPGKASNPRIVLYHSTTSDGAAPDSVPWCSSFVNFCVERAGIPGTDSKWSKSWLTWKGGTPVAKGDWRQGDIMIFHRGAIPSGSSKADLMKKGTGHVAFIHSLDGDRPLLLGGNQADKVCIDDPYSYKSLLGVVRP